MVRGDCIAQMFPIECFQDHLRLEFAPMPPPLHSHRLVYPEVLMYHPYSVVSFLGYIINCNGPKRPRIAAAALTFQTRQAPDSLRRTNTLMLIDVI
jgi:hypothetical protein